jgi:hypothetical protein
MDQLCEIAAALAGKPDSADAIHRQTAELRR